MSDECIFPGCTNKREDLRSYRNCNKCGRSVGSIYTEYCEKHDRYSVNSKTKCRYQPPTEWSCLRCYPEDFDNWIPDEEQGTLEEWKSFVEEYKQDL